MRLWREWTCLYCRRSAAVVITAYLATEHASSKVPTKVVRRNRAAAASRQHSRLQCLGGLPSHVLGVNGSRHQKHVRMTARLAWMVLLRLAALRRKPEPRLHDGEQ